MARAKVFHRVLGPSGTRAMALSKTRPSMLGPAWRPFAPFRTDLTGGMRGTPLHVSGRILSTDNYPIAHAVVEVWQANSRGLYSNWYGLGYLRKERGQWLRARIRSDAWGQYSFDTIEPAHYPLGPLTRPKHIHFRVRAKGYRTLVTQLYFTGDPVLRWHPFVPTSLIKTASEDFDVRTIKFDLVLAPRRLHLPRFSLGNRAIG